MSTRSFRKLRASESGPVSLRFTWLDTLIVAPVTALTLAAVLARLITLLYTSDTWYHPSLRGLYAFTRLWL